MAATSSRPPRATARSRRSSSSSSQREGCQPSRRIQGSPSYSASTFPSEGCSHPEVAHGSEGCCRAGGPVDAPEPRRRGLDGAVGGEGWREPVPFPPYLSPLHG